MLRAANPLESSEVVKECLDLILPLLIDKGLVAPTLEGKGLTLGTIVSIVKVSKQHLDTWLPRLIGVLGGVYECHGTTNFAIHEFSYLLV